MIRFDDHDPCECGCIRAVHFSYELKGAEVFGQCRGSFTDSGGRKHPCQCNQFKLHLRMPHPQEETKE